MPPPISDQEVELRRKARRRLVGAIALVMALVVILPRLLDHEPKPIDANIPIRLPQASAQQAASAPSAAAAATEVEKSTAATPSANVNGSGAPQATMEQAGSAVAAADAQASKEPTASNAPAPPDNDRPAAAGSGEFVVQVGAFSNGSKAEQAQRKVAAAGLPVFTETVDVDGQARIRVRAGPFAERTEAEAALEKLNAAGFGGKLMMR